VIVRMAMKCVDSKDKMMISSLLSNWACSNRFPETTSYVGTDAKVVAKYVNKFINCWQWVLCPRSNEDLTT
jgi:hypothetical protein